MDQEKIRIGMKVRITSIRITHKRHNSCSEMNEMIGKIWKVTKIRNARDYLSGNSIPKSGTLTITVNDSGHGYVWAPEDLEYAGPIPEMPKKVTFNPENIVKL
jgi:hypothetical protein